MVEFHDANRKRLSAPSARELAQASEEIHLLAATAMPALAFAPYTIVRWWTPELESAPYQPSRHLACGPHPVAIRADDVALGDLSF